MITGVNHLQISLHADQEAAAVALCATVGQLGDGVPDWLHLLPAGDIRTADGRGPYRYADAAKLMAASLPAGERLVLDENHATDLAAPQGGSAPAMGWIVALQARPDGIWGQVEWTEAGRQLVAGRAYRAISPVIAHDKSGAIGAILRASLVNKPNLRGLTTLHQEDDSMTLLEQLAKALGLTTDISETALVAAITTLHQVQQDTSVALQAQLGPIAQAAGLGAEAKPADIITTVTALVAGAAAPAAITALQAELTAVSTELKALRDTGAREKATAFVDGAILQRKAGVKPLRDHYIAMHMADPARVEKEIGAMVSLQASHTGALPPPNGQPGTAGLTPDEHHIVSLMGLDAEAYAKTKAQIEAAL